MIATRDQILEAALALSEADRMQLVDALMGTLPTDNAIEPDEDFVAELERRCAEVDAGRAQPIPFEEIMERHRSKYPTDG